MANTFWKAKERRILRKWFGTSRIGSTGKPNPDGMTRVKEQRKVSGKVLRIVSMILSTFFEGR
jgi:hypothetical protein